MQTRDMVRRELCLSERYTALACNFSLDRLRMHGAVPIDLMAQDELEQLVEWARGSRDDAPKKFTDYVALVERQRTDPR